MQSTAYGIKSTIALPWDAAVARTTEALTALLISVNARYKVHAGVRLTSLPEHLWE